MRSVCRVVADPAKLFAMRGATGLRSYVGRRPVASFLVLTFVLLWLSSVPVLFFGWPPPPPTTAVGHLVAGILGACSLALPAFVVTAVADGRDGVRDLLRRTFRWRVAIRWYLFAAFAIPVGALVLAPVFLGAAPIQALGQNWSLLFTAFLPRLLLALMTIQLFEEVAWTGFAQHRLQARYGGLKAALLVGPMFALIHLPTYLFGGPVTGERVVAALITTLVVIPVAMFLRILIAWTYNGAGFSVLIAGLVHASWNSAAAVMSPVSGGAAELLTIGSFVLLAILVTAFTRARLGYQRPRPTPADTTAPSSGSEPSRS